MDVIRIVKHVIVLSFLFQIQSLFSQYENYPVKEKYDQLNVPAVEEYSPCTISSIGDEEAFGNGHCHILEGYITMYETTGDKAYLYKFIFQSLCMMENRHDYAGVELSPRWSDNMYLNGNIVAAFARFAHLVKNNSTLYNSALYPFNTIVNNSFNTTFSTFGDYSNWLQGRCGETLWYFSNNGYWLSNGFRRLGQDEPMEINMQVGFTRAMLYIGLNANEPSFLTKANIIANQFKSTVNIVDYCKGKILNTPVFLVNSDNAYQWYHAGWRVTKENSCSTSTFPFFFTNVPQYDEYVKFKEDISHGAPVTWLVNDFRKYQPSTPFNLTDMVRFKNTFAKRIYAGNGNFHNAVDGTDNPVYCGDNCVSNFSMNYYQYEYTPLNYMYLSEYDAFETTSPTVYEILMDFYQNKLLNTTTKPSFYQGMANKGHAETVQAHWQRECFSLSLFNRNVVYNQDFFAKKNLVVNPSEGPTTSYADPIIYEPTFTVQGGITANLTAGESVSLKPGTQFKAGSNVRVSIVNGCSTGGSGMIAQNLETEFKHINSEQNEVINKRAEFGVGSEDNFEHILKPTVYPNPFDNYFIVNSSKEDLLVIKSAAGTIVGNYSVSAGETFISTSNLSQGVYIISLMQQGEQFKIVKQ